MCPGLLETRFYAAHGIPAFAYGPGLLSVSHGPNEFVPIRNIALCATIYALTAAVVFNADSADSANIADTPIRRYADTPTRKRARDSEGKK
jgi:hypothetical protein